MNSLNFELTPDRRANGMLGRSRDVFVRFAKTRYVKASAHFYFVRFSNVFRSEEPFDFANNLQKHIICVLKL